jgi:phosphoribosylformimino-5-aminoimidazole carboxamide ribotide isomerase
MVIYPAIDIIDGKCVSLVQGLFHKETTYSDNPIEVALEWENMGSEYLHIIDLDGAKTGKPKNAHIVSEMAAKLCIPIQLGGGIRSIETIEIFLSKGIEKVILGTAAVRDQKFLKEALKIFRENIIIGIDAKDGVVAIEGWAKTSHFTSVDFAKKMEELGAYRIIYTDISKDGMLQGPNFEATKKMVNAVDIEVIASGGVSRVRDIEKLKEIGVYGAIVGKALYTGDINLKEALKVAKIKDGGEK